MSSLRSRFPVSRKTLILATSSLVLAILILLLLVRPQAGRQAEKEEEIAAAQEDLVLQETRKDTVLQRIQEVQARIRQEQDLLERLRQNNQAIDEYMARHHLEAVPPVRPYNQDTTLLPDALAELLADSGLGSSQVRLLEYLDKGVHGVLFQISGSGSLADIQSLLRGLAETPFVGNIQEMQIQDYADQRLFRAKILIPLADDSHPDIRTSQARTARGFGGEP
jgi:hypothetical protein